jgi:hypothetical protein
MAQQRTQLSQATRKTGLYKDEADRALATRSVHSVVLSLDAKKGPINTAYRLGGIFVVFVIVFAHVLASIEAQILQALHGTTAHARAMAEAVRYCGRHSIDAFDEANRTTGLEALRKAGIKSSLPMYEDLLNLSAAATLLQRKSVSVPGVVLEILGDTLVQKGSGFNRT